MINIMAKQAIVMAKMQITHYRLKDLWCKEQEDDIEEVLKMVEDLVETAITSGNSAMSQSQLQNSKHDFVNHFLTVCSKYRLIDDPDRTMLITVPIQVPK